MNEQDPEFWPKMAKAWEHVANERLRQIEEWKHHAQVWREQAQGLHVTAAHWEQRAKAAEAMLKQTLPESW